MSTQRLTRSERALIGFGITVPTLALIAVTWTQGINGMPPLELPKRNIPLPNANDTLTQAAQARVKQVGTANVEELAFKAKPLLADRIALRTANAAAIQLTKRALQQEYYQPQSPSMTALYPEFAEYRGLARVLAYNSETAALQGNYPAATEDALDAIQLGVKIPRGGPLIGALVGYACEAIGRKALWNVADQLDAATLHRTLDRLTVLEKERTPFADTLAEEKLGSQVALREMLAHPMEATNSLGYKESNLALSAYVLVAPKRTVLEANARYFDALVERARQPYLSAKPYPTMPKDVLNQILLPVFAQADYKAVQARTEQALLQAYLAVRLYQKEHGALPESLPEPIADPFGQEKPLHYRKDSATAFTLYSVGPDGDDDHGRAGIPSDASASSELKKRTRGRYLNNNDEGDFVARINTY